MVLYFVTFILFVGIILLNVILTVLIEGFMSSMKAEEEAFRVGTEVREHQKMAGALDPLLSTLANFRSPQHLESQLELLFSLFDIDDSGAVDFEELKLGLRKLGYEPCIVVSAEDWDVLSMQGTLCNSDGALGLEGFMTAMRFQLSHYSQRLLANKMSLSLQSESELAPMLFALKMVMMQVMFLENEDEVERLQVAGFIASPDPARVGARTPHSRRQFLGWEDDEDAEDEAGSRDGRGGWSGQGQGGEESEVRKMGEELRLMREMVLDEKRQAEEERRLAREERACAAEVSKLPPVCACV